MGTGAALLRRPAPVPTRERRVTRSNFLYVFEIVHVRHLPQPDQTAHRSPVVADVEARDMHRPFAYPDPPGERQQQRHPVPATSGMDGDQRAGCDLHVEVAEDPRPAVSYPEILSMHRARARHRWR